MNTLPLIRLGSSVVGRIAPRHTAKFAHKLFTSPRRLPAGNTEQHVAATAERFRLQVGWSALRFGPKGSPRVLCVHGWEGRASQFGVMATALVRQGYQVISIDGPGHGQSPERQAHAIAFARAALDADRELGPFEAVVGHSMGAAAITIALEWGLRANKAVTLAGPADIADVIDRFSRFIALPPAAQDHLKTRLRHHVGVPTEKVSLLALARELPLPVLLIHDQDDAEVPVDDARRLAKAWPNVSYIETEGLGHGKVLYGLGVVDRIVTFVGAAQATSRQDDEGAVGGTRSQM